jgi:CheY-like chemotaxis protein
VARTALERAGYEVQIATSGTDAIQIVRSRVDGFSLILLDLSMPAMDGIDALGYLRALDPDIPILLASGYSETEMRQRSEGLTVSGFIQKPFTSRNLREKVAFHLRSAQRALRNRSAG